MTTTNGRMTATKEPPPSARRAEDAAVIEPMLTPEEVAELLKISKATLCRMTKRGEIPHKRIGDRIVRYQRAAIVAWMNGANCSGDA